MHMLSISKISSIQGFVLVLAFVASGGVSPTLSAKQAHVAADLPTININNGFATLVEAVKPSVVAISASYSASQRHPNFNRQSPKSEEFFEYFFGKPPESSQREWGARPQPHSNPAHPKRKSTAAGSGFIIAPEGLVVTNYHVIENADDIEVILDDGTRLKATLEGSDSETDLALLKIVADRSFPYVKFGDSDTARVGDWVIAIGNPFELGGTTTSGIISARGRDIQSGPLDDFIQIDASINRGNSGGPLFNIKGEVIGVNSAIISPTGGNIGIGFAIPSSMASVVIAQLRENGIVERGFLGVLIQHVNKDIAESIGLEEPAGALVTQVVMDSPAEKAGIQVGDVILNYAGKTINKMRDLPKVVALTEDQTKVNIKVWRDGRQHSLQASIITNHKDSRSDEQSQSSHPNDYSNMLGFSVAPLDHKSRRAYGIEADEGVVVSMVVPSGAAAKNDVRVGDLIKRINKHRISTLKDMKEAIRLANHADKKSILLLVVRDQQARFVSIPLKPNS